MNKTFILILACILIACQFVNCSTQVSAGSVTTVETTASLVEQPKKISSLVASSESNIIAAHPRSTQACSCSLCQTDTDEANRYYMWNTTCADPRNFAYSTLNIGSDNTAETYNVYYFKSDEYIKMQNKQTNTYMSRNIANCISASTATVFNSASLISSYYCTTAVQNATSCTTKYKFSGGCYIGLNSMVVSSKFESGKLKVQVDLYGTDAKIWTRPESNIKVSVSSTSFSTDFTSKNIYQGSTMFTFNVPSTTVSYSINVEAENYFGVLSQTSTQDRSSGVVTFGYSVMVFVLATLIAFITL